MRDGPARVVVVEDSLVAREGMVAVIRSLPDMLVVGTATHAGAAHEVIADVTPDVVITDIRMPPGQHDEGITLARELADAKPGLAVLVVSQFCEPHLAARLFARGSTGRGYLIKDRIADPGVMRDAIRGLMGGGTVIDPSVVAGMIVDNRGHDTIRMAGLTPRESQVIELMAAGRSNGAIAAQMGITRRGVEKNVSQIFAKLGLGDDDTTSPRVAATLLWLEGTRPRADADPPAGLDRP